MIKCMHSYYFDRAENQATAGNGGELVQRQTEQFLANAKGGEMMAVQYDHNNKPVAFQKVPRGGEIDLMLRKKNVYLWRALVEIVSSAFIQPYIQFESIHKIESLGSLAQQCLSRDDRDNFLRAYDGAAEIVRRDVDLTILQHPTYPHLQEVLDYLEWRPNRPSFEEAANLCGILQLSTAEGGNDVSAILARISRQHGAASEKKEIVDLEARVSALELEKCISAKVRKVGYVAGAGASLALSGLGQFASTKFALTFIFSSPELTAGFIAFSLGFVGAVAMYHVVVYALPKFFKPPSAKNRDVRPEDMTRQIDAIVQPIIGYQDTRG